MVNMKKQILYLGTVVILFTTLFAQDNIIARFNNNNITVEEYLKRFELTPRVQSSTNIDTQKVHFLYTLLAEKLWAAEAREKNLDTLYSFRQYINNLEKMLVRDALFKRVIERKVAIGENDIEAGLTKKRYELQLKFLFSYSKSEIDSLHKKLSSISIDTLLAGKPEKLEQPEPIIVVFGQMDEELEDTLFGLSPNEFTKPIYKEKGWVIYYLAGKRELVSPSLSDIGKTRNEVVQILEYRQRRKLVKNYLKELLTDVKADTDGELFQTLAMDLSKLLKQRYHDANLENYILYENDITKLIQSSNSDDKPFVKFPTDPVTYTEFLYYLYSNNFQSSGIDINSVRNALSSVIYDFISLEVVAREGYKRNLELLPEVKDALKMWKDNFLSQYLRNTYNPKAKISESELNDFISTQIDSSVSTKFVSITEVRLNNLEQAKHLLSQLRYNYKFEEILEQMNIPKSSIVISEKLQPLSSFGELARIIDEMSEGEAYGPIVKASGYSIIKLNRMEERELTGKEKNRLQLATQKEILFYKKLGRILNEKTIEFAKKYDLNINEQILSELKVTEIPTLIYRYYGFGGQSVAAPFLNLFYDWYYKYKSQKENPL